jgi:hypothetical protein
LGIRLRHAFFDEWIRKRSSVNEVVKRIDTAFFDPEFSENYSSQIQNAWELKKSKIAFRL